MLRVRSGARYALPILALLIATSCVDNGREPVYSKVEPLEPPAIPEADTTTTVNVNIDNPTLRTPDTVPVADGDTLTLVWSDEFDGEKLDPEVWFFEEGDGSQYGIPGWGNNELQYYLPDNARLEGGLLIIEARRETVGDSGFTSARITTQDRLSVKYGRIEARMKLPGGAGIWPAFWMLPQDDEPGSAPADGIYGGFSASGEIDIMEAVNLGGLPGPAGFGGGNTVFGTIHFGGEFPANQFTTEEYTLSTSLTDQFNDFAVEWDEDEIRWYANNILYATQNNWSSDAEGAAYPAPFDQPFKILFNLAVGGNFPGPVDGSTPFPTQMEVDWVRVYSGEGEDGGPESTPTAPPAAPGEDPATVTSIFSGAYASVDGVDLNPDRGQTTAFSILDFAGDEVIKLSGLDFQFIDFAGNPQDVSDKGYLSVDVWTANSTEFNVALLDTSSAVAAANGGTTSQSVPVTPNTWVSANLSLNGFHGVDVGDVKQIRFDGNGTVFIDNIFFAGDPEPPVNITPPPDDVIYATDPNVMVDLMTTTTTFETSTAVDEEYALDPDFKRVIQAVSGSGYSLDHILQLGFVGLDAGFAIGYDSFAFKIKSDGLPGNSIVIKLEQGGECRTVDLADTTYSTGLGNGWFEVEIPMTECIGVETAVGVLFERIGPATADGGTQFSALFTDIGFNGTATGPTPGNGADISAGIDFEDGNVPPAFADFNGGVSTILDNPDASGINTSDKAVRMQKFAGDAAAGTTLTLDPVIDFGNGEAFTMKVWANREVPVLFKLEGPPAKERSVNHPGGSEWVELCFDFTGDQPGATTGLTLIFDLLVEGDAANNADDWTFFYDEIEQVASCPTGPADAFPIDFEADPGTYSYGDFGGGATAVIANPDQSGINTTAQVTRMQKFAQDLFGGSTLTLSAAEDFSDGEVFTMKVWSTREVPVLFKFEGASDAEDRERTVNHPGGSEWVELCYDFTGDTPPGGSSALTFIFENGTNGDAGGNPDAWTFYFDEIEQVASCPTGPADAFPIDFEADPGTYSYGDFGGGATAVIANPDQSGINTTAQVTRMQKFAQDLFGGSTLTLSAAEDFSDGEVFTMKVWSTREVPVLFKFEGASDAEDRERTVNHPGGSEWVELCYDFTGDTPPGGSSALTFIFENGTNGDAGGNPDAWTFYFDEIEQVASCPTGPADAFPIDFEADPGTYSYGDFGGGATAVIANPDQSGINTTAQVTRMQKFAQDLFGGSTLTLSAAEDFSDGEVFTMKVWSTREVPVLFKFEGASDAEDRERTVNHPGGSEWVELCYDFTGDTPPGGSSALTFIFENGTNGDAGGNPDAWTFYFDEIEQVASCPGGGGGGGTGSELIINGDFEAGGGSLSDWTQDVPAGASINLTTPGADGSGSAATLSLTSPANLVLKQVNLAVGEVTPNQQLTLSFDYKATVASSGEIAVQVLSEFAGSGSSTDEVLRTATPPADWTSFEQTVTLGGDVGGGVSLQFIAVCGAVAGCLSELSVDNVSLTTAGGG